MKFNFDLSQPSTQRGIIWLVFGVAGIIFAWFGKDSSALLPIFTAMIAAGAHGAAVDDKSGEQ